MLITVMEKRLVNESSIEWTAVYRNRDETVHFLHCIYDTSMDKLDAVKKTRDNLPKLSVVQNKNTKVVGGDWSNDKFPEIYGRIIEITKNHYQLGSDTKFFFRVYNVNGPIVEWIILCADRKKGRFNAYIKYNTELSMVVNSVEDTDGKKLPSIHK